MIAGSRESPELDAVMALGLLFMAAVALGGVFDRLIVFDWTWEYPILILAAGLLVPQLFLLPGSGTLACYAQRGQSYEIDPAVVGLAHGRFRFLEQCLARRLLVGRSANMHLMRLEAFRT